MGLQRAANMAASGASRAEIRAANPGLSGAQISSAMNSAPAPAPAPAPAAAPAPMPTRPDNIPASYSDAGGSGSYNTRPVTTDKGIYWAAGPMSDDEIRNWVSGVSGTGFNADASAWTGAASAQSTSQAQASNTSNRSGPRAGSFAAAGTNISRREALKIAKNKGISVAEVMDRALDKGRTLGASLVNKYNAGKLDDRSYIEKATDKVYSDMGASPKYQPKSLSRLSTFGRMPRGSTYGGMTSTGVPILGTKVPKDLLNRSVRGDTTPTGGGTAPTGGDTFGNTSGSFASEMPMEMPMMEPEPTMPTMPGFGSDVLSTATGFRTKKSSRRGGGARAQGLGSQRVAPIGGWNYNLG